MQESHSVLRVLQSCLLVLASTLLAIFAAETLARVLGFGVRFGRLLPIHDVPTRTVDGVVIWSDPYPRYDSEDLRRAAAPDAFTIIGLGDSILFGVGQEKKDTYLERTRLELARRSKSKVEVLNLAVPGFNTLQEDAVYKEIADRIKPDLVVVHYWGDDWHQYRLVGGYVVDVGDISEDGRLVVRALPLPPRVSDFLLVHSRIYDMLTRFVLDRRPREPLNMNRVYDPLAAIHERVQRVGGRLLVLASPELDGPWPKPVDLLRDVKEFAANRGFEVIDLSQWLSGVESKRIAMDGCHFNAEGHRLIGERLAEYLLQHDLKEPNDS